VKLDKLDALLVQTSTSAQDVSLFADMLSLPNDGRYPVRQFDSEKQRTHVKARAPSALESSRRLRFNRST
jgi:hypothetical protein